MIRIDILCPTGGKNGGIENIIRLWTQNLIQDEYDLRVIHMTPGTAYLHGYEKHLHLMQMKMKVIMIN